MADFCKFGVKLQVRKNAGNLLTNRVPTELSRIIPLHGLCYIVNKKQIKFGDCIHHTKSKEIFEVLEIKLTSSLSSALRAQRNKRVQFLFQQLYL